MAKLFFEDCERSPFVATLEDGTDMCGLILARAMRDEETEIAKFVDFVETSKDGTQRGSGFIWLVSSSVTLTDEEGRKLAEFEKRFKERNEKTKSNSIAGAWFDEFAVDRPIGKPSTRKRKTKKPASKRAKR